MKNYCIFLLLISLCSCSKSMNTQEQKEAGTDKPENSACVPLQKRFKIGSTSTDVVSVKLLLSTDNKNYSEIKTYSQTGNVNQIIEIAHLGYNPCERHYFSFITIDRAGNASDRSSPICWGSACP